MKIPALALTLLTLALSQSAAIASPAGPDAGPATRAILVGLSADANPANVAAALNGSVLEVVESKDKQLRYASIALSPATNAPMVKADLDKLGILGMSDPAEPVTWAPLQASTPPKDVFLTQQRATHFNALDAEAAWSLSTGRSAVIGFVDTGSDCNHPDLKGAWLDNESLVFPSVEFVSFDTTGSGPTRYGGGCADSIGHGTTTSGLAGARGDNSLGVAGMAYDARMIMAKALSAGQATTIDIIEAIILLVEWGVDVLNLSLGTYTTRLGEATVERQLYDITSVCSALDWGLRNGSVSVAASGNDGRRRVYYPAGCSATLGVGALAANSASDRWVASGSVGSTTGPHVDVVAPGAQLFGIQGAPGRRGYGEVGSGTSYSAALTSGAVALMVDVAIRRGVTSRGAIALAAREIIQDTAAPLPASASGQRAQGSDCGVYRSQEYGCGRVDAGAAVIEMARWADTYVRRFGGRTPTPDAGGSGGATATPEIGIFDTPDAETTATATFEHHPAVRTALAALTQAAEPTATPTVDEVSAILTSIAPLDPTSVSATMTALFVDVPGTLTAIAPTMSPRQRAYGTATMAAAQTQAAQTATATPPPPVPPLSILLGRGYAVLLPKLGGAR